MNDILQQAVLKQGMELTTQQLEQFETYARLLVEWNEKMNLTAITEKDEIAIKHFVDSFGGARVIQEKLKKNETCSLVDVGCGAGFPGLPLKILFPKLQVTLLDALQKRIGFLNAVIQELGLQGVTTVHDRAEDGAHRKELREQFDFASARAVANLPILMEYCAGYVRPGGAFLAYKGPTLEEELQVCGRAMKVLNLKHQETILSPGMEDMHHYVAVFLKTGPLALQYPRKQSKIKLSPLGTIKQGES